MAGKKHDKKEYNQNWESEIKAYDDECNRIDAEFYSHALIINPSSGNTELTEEENEVLTMYLKGTSCSEIAVQNDVELSVVTGLLEIIRAKLSLIE
ncbi:MAG: hypothetical protein JXB48_10620 [Candidatus Latescibacteria bacterium]|nr:hypothetical protein [Candidatus Latescibacterota bacterium]